MSPLAMHEASHVVTATVLNVPWLHAEVRADGSGSLFFDGQPSSWGCETLHRRAAIVALAGACGEARFTGERTPWPRADREMADSYLAGAAESFADLSLAACRCVERYWSAIRRVADHLEQFSTISPPEALECMQTLKS